MPSGISSSRVARICTLRLRNPAMWPPIYQGSVGLSPGFRSLKGWEALVRDVPVAMSQ